MQFRLAACLVGAALISFTAGAGTTNSTIRIMASNLTSGNYQRYETAGIDILQALKPDIAAMQEFNYASATLGTNTTAALREMIDKTFGTNFVYFRQTGVNIPNGIVSRFPIINSGVWDDTTLSDRDFVWAQIDIPGTNDLYIVSVHLKASSSSASQRASQSTTLKGLIQANFPANAYVVVAGDCNLYSTGEACYTTMTSYLTDPSPVPNDSAGDADTNEPRSERYDYVFASPSLNVLRVSSIVGSHTFTNGLVFDSAKYPTLSEVSPVQSGDSHVTGMQHMAVIKDFQLTYTITDPTVPAPTLVLSNPNIVQWQGIANTTYSIQLTTDFQTWSAPFAVTSSSSAFTFTNPSPDPAQTFYRVTYP
ncbi:MAG: endonuclease/exonuclease/phosphatase family protein [Limisphaerales bacterium]